MPRKRSRSTSVLSQATQIAEAIHEKDQIAEAQLDQDRALRSTMQLKRIKPRPEDTRPLHELHVRDLVESIAALGLIEPLVVDSQGVLLAGGHRLAALEVLKESDGELFSDWFPKDEIPVRVMSFDASLDPERSLQVELAENEKRVNYSRDQIELLADRLRSLNYRETRGRPKAGEKALGPALAVAIGVSTRYVRKVLSEQRKGSETQGHKAEQENRNSVPIFQRRLKILRKIETQIEEMLTLPTTEKEHRASMSVVNATPSYLKKIRACIEKDSQELRKLGK